MKRNLVLLISALVSLHAAMTGFRMAAPLLLLREGQTTAAIGVLLSLFALSQIFLALPAGQLSDRLGMHKCYMLAVAAASTGALLAAIWPNVWVLCLVAFLTGAATGLVAITLQIEVGRMTQNTEHLRAAFSWLSIGPAMSNFIGPLSIGLAIDFVGFRWAFLLLALYPLLGWCLLRKVVPQAIVPKPVSQKASPAWALLRDLPMRRLLLVNWFLAACWDAHTFMVPVLGHERNISASAIGSILGVFALAAACTRLLLPWVGRHLKEGQVIHAAMLASALLLVLYPFASQAVAMGALSALMGLHLGAVQPMVMSKLHQITPTHRLAQALGLRMICINVCSVGMPILFGAISSTLGATPVFWGIAALVIAGSPMARKL